MTKPEKAVMQRALDALPDMVELSSPMDERAVYGYTAEQMQAYARTAIAQPAHESIASDAIECVANPVQPAELMWCGCGDGYPANSFEAGVMSSIGKCPNCAVIAQPAEFTTGQEFVTFAQPEQTAEPVAWITEDGRVASNATKQMSMASPSKAVFNIPLYLSCSIAQPIEADDLTIAYMSGLADGKKAAQTAHVPETDCGNIAQTNLVVAAQAVLDRWNSPQWEWIKCGPTDDLMHVLRDAIAQPEQPNDAYQEVVSLAKALFKKHYSNDPDYANGKVIWGVCDTTAGVISQINNMVSGLSRTLPESSTQKYKTLIKK